jgi:ectoine hydroxylase-related dioxygenase (phytanoyl-CoA dioxygenase family)
MNGSQLSVVMTVPSSSRLECAAGDAMLIDSRVLHCGGANASALRRRLLYLTLKVCRSYPVKSDKRHNMSRVTRVSTPHDRCRFPCRVTVWTTAYGQSMLGGGWMHC